MKGGRADVRAIKEKVDILSVVGRYVSLTKAGSSHKGRCPFHKDDTPSMVVNAEKGLWHCFGCGEGGDIIAFLMKIERLTFVEAVRRLAEEVGLSFDAGEDAREQTLRQIVSAAADRFAEALRDPEAGRRAREYLAGRGYDEPVWERFGLGYAPPGWDFLKRALAPRHGTAVLIELGLLVQGKKGAYDRFRDRTIFPIFDLGGRPIAFGGRAFEGEPKYLNSPRTTLFDKGRVLYGLSWAREAISEARRAVLVEGYTDVLTLHVAGLTEAVGSMGTALTQGQADLLGRFADEVVIAYDRDAAGGAASLRGMQILRNSGLSVRVAQLPPQADPDSLVRSGGADAMQSAIADAVPFHRFYVDAAIGDRDVSSVIGKERVLSEGREFFRTLRSVPLRHEIARQFADRLDLPLEEVRRYLVGRGPVRPAKAEMEWVEERWGEEEVILSLLLRGEISWDRIAALASPEDFSGEHRPIVEALAMQSASFTMSDILEHLDEESSRRASFYALAPVEFSDTEKAIGDALARLVRLPAIERKLAEIDEEIAACERDKDWERWSRLTKRKVALVNEKLSRRGAHDTETL